MEFSSALGYCSFIKSANTEAAPDRITVVSNVCKHFTLTHRFSRNKEPSPQTLSRAIAHFSDYSSLGLQTTKNTSIMTGIEKTSHDVKVLDIRKRNKI